MSSLYISEEKQKCSWWAFSVYSVDFDCVPDKRAFEVEASVFSSACGRTLCLYRGRTDVQPSGFRECVHAGLHPTPWGAAGREPGVGRTSSPMGRAFPGSWLVEEAGGSVNLGRWSCVSLRFLGRSVGGKVLLPHQAGVRLRRSWLRLMMLPVITFPSSWWWWDDPRSSHPSLPSGCFRPPLFGYFVAYNSGKWVTFLLSGRSW